jgi:two-component system, cell cycle sensor histidine kinase and response regulator CckA
VARIFYLVSSEREEAVHELRDKGCWSGELRQIDRNGDEYYIQSRQQLFRDDAGEPVAVVCYNTNVTELKKQEDADERAHHVRSSSILAGGVAHELNNALAPIMLSAAMLKRSLEDEKSRNMVSMIEKCANKGAVLIADLLSFERGKGVGMILFARPRLSVR